MIAQFSVGLMVALFIVQVNDCTVSCGFNVALFIVQVNDCAV